MNGVVAYKLRFKTPLHIDTQGIGYERTEDTVHSDTIFSALMSLWYNFYDDNIEEMCKNPPFIISSAFPFKSETYFFPRPMIRIGKEKEDDQKKGKELKKVNYVSKNILEILIADKNLEFDEKNTLQKGKFWVAKDELPKEKVIFKEREVPRVTIDRATNSSDIFYFSEILFEKDSGLFFLVKFLNEKLQKKFEVVLRLLGDEGIGGDKHLGKGLFTAKKEPDFQMLIPENRNGIINLSLYHPTEEEINAGIMKDASYKLITRKGWIHSIGAMSLRRQSVRMFQECSTFISLRKKYYGDCPLVLEKNVDIGLSHNIYRYGLGFFLPIKKRKENG